MHDAQKVRFWLIAALLTAVNLSLWLVFTSNDPALVRVAHSTSAARFDQTGRLTMRFDRDIFPDEALNTRPDTPPFAIEPPIEGSWLVYKTDTIILEPTDPPPPGRTYKVQITPDHPLLRDIEIDQTTLPEVALRPPAVARAILENSVPKTADDGTQLRRSTIAITFNQDVSRAACAQHVQVDVGDNSHTPRWIGDALSRTHRFEIDTAPATPLKLTVNAGLTGHGGSIGMDASFTRTIPIPAGLAAIGVDAGAFRWGGEDAELAIKFSRTLSASQAIPTIAVTPDIGPISTRIRGRNLLIRGAFKHGHQYSVEVDPPLIATDGSALEAKVVRPVQIPAARPRLSFERRVGRLGTQGAFALDLQSRSVETANLSIHRLLDQHTPVYLSGVMRDHQVPKLGELICETQITMPVDGQHAKGGPTAIALDAFMERTPGVYYIQVADTDRRWTRDNLLLFVGDLTIDLQTHADGMLAWVTDTNTGQSVAGATVTAWSKNRRALETGTTDADGLAQLHTGTKEGDLVTARLDDDIIFVRPRSATAIDDRSLSGAPWAGPLDVALYADRGVHRPGETVHLSGVVRTAAGDMPGALPLEVRFTRPDDRVMVRKVVTSDPQQGVLHIDLPTAQDDVTGNWIASVHLAGDDAPIASLRCPVMPVLPVRLAVTATPLEPDGSDQSVDITSTYLHGAPAAGLPASLGATFTPQRHADDRWPQFKFEDPPTSKPVKRLVKGTLDTKGETTLTVSAPTTSGTWRVALESTVNELGGRATTTRSNTLIDTASAHLGLRTPNGKLYRTTETIPIEVIVLDAEGNPSSGNSLTLMLEHIDNEWQLVDAPGGGRQWRSVEISTPVEGADIALMPRADRWAATIPALPAGTYRLRVATTSPQPIAVSLPLHISDSTARGRVKADRPDRLELIAEHDAVTPGMDTSVLIRTPFPGLALVTVETDKIHRAEIVPVNGDGARVPVTVPDKARDTCFVGATLVRPLDPKHTQWLPLRARGAVRLRVDRGVHEVEAALSAVDRARPGETVDVVLSVPGHEQTDEASPSPSPSVHLWAVEEGALLLTDYTVPDLVAAFLRDRMRMVASASTIDELLPDYDRPVGVDRIGSDVARRFRSPVPIRQRDIEVLWQASRPLPDDGTLELELPMPQLDGAMRIMALVIDGDRYGRTEHLVAVASPLALTGALPRAVAPGDGMTVPLMLHNRGDVPVETSLSLQCDDIFNAGVTPPSLVVPAGGQAQAFLKLTASEPGIGKISIRAVPDTGDEAHFEGAIAVRPPHGRVRETVSLRAAPGERLEIDRRRDLDMLSGHVDVVIGGNPSVELAPVMQDLIDYPWGCAEQTGSRVQGMLAALRLPESVTGVDAATLRGLCASGLAGLWHMQRPDGGMSYWRSGGADPWITHRTALLAFDARDAGVAVPDDLIDGLLTWTRANGRRFHTDSKRDHAAMACRVLARAGTPDSALLRSLAAMGESLGPAARAHLVDAAAVEGEVKLAAQLVEAIQVPVAVRSKGRFHSKTSATALLLDVLLRNDIEHPATLDLVRELNGDRGPRGWRNTFENAAAIDALSRWIAGTDTSGTARGVVHIAGQEIAFDGNEPVRASFDVDGSSDEVEWIDSTGDGPVTVLIVSSGVPSSSAPLPVLDSVMKVGRRWLNELGEELAPGTPLQAGDLVTVVLRVESATDSLWTDVALVDVLPGGMEFELPALATSAGSNEVDLAKVDRVEFRDDRLVAFLTVEPDPRELRYVLRAVVPGEWAVPAPDALAMYEPQGHGRGAAGRVRIELP